MAVPATISRSNTVIRNPVGESLTNVTSLFTAPEVPNGIHRVLEPANHSSPNEQSTFPAASATKASSKMEGLTNGQPDVIDPISRQILQRTTSIHKESGPFNPTTSTSYGVASVPEEPNALARQGTGITDVDSLRRSDTLTSNKGTKDKKKGFLSRILGTKNKTQPDNAPDNASEVLDNREAGTYAEVFSQPRGFGTIPTFPAPPRYIRVKAQNRKKRDLDRLFLAQILSEGAPRSQKAFDAVDAKIHSINDHPVVPPPNSTRTKNNAIWAAEFSKDGQYYAAGGQDKKLKVWRVISSREDRENGGDEGDQNVKLNAPVFRQELVREYEGHTSAILDLSWSKNNFLLSSSMDKTVRLYHISRPECLCAFKHNDFVTSISFHPRDDRFFLAGSLDSKIRLWSIPDKNVAYWAQVQDMVTAVAFTPDGKTAIAGTLSGLCILYNTEGLVAHSQIHVKSNRGKNSKGSKITGIETITLPRQTGPPDIKLLITSNDSRVRLYNLRDRSLEAKFRSHENSTSQIRASFSDDGKYIICGSEDKRVYVWSTEPLERLDSERQPVEIFEAHTAIVTTALLLPTKSRRLLARSGDPIYDLCNPPPVRLLSRTDSLLSSQAPTEHSERGDPARRPSESPQASLEESPQYTNKLSHNGGLILVTGDYTGEIKVFRQDCAYQKRKDGAWDSASFSKKMLGRSGSITTRTSDRSSMNRKSIILGEPRSPANPEIINWRNSIVSAKSGSAATSTSEVALPDSLGSSSQQERERTPSPVVTTKKRGFVHKFSLRHGSTPLANASRPSMEESRRLRTPSTAESGQQRGSVATINTATSAGHHNAFESAHPFSTSNVPTISTQESFPQAGVPNISLTSASPVLNDSIAPQGHQNEGLYLENDRSYTAWDVQHNLLPMANAQPRTPDPNLRPNPLGREESFVSTLSSELLSSTGTPSSEAQVYERTDNAGLGIDGDGTSPDQQSENEELKCKRCGNESFLMIRSHAGNVAGTSGLKCRRCGEQVG